MNPVHNGIGMMARAEPTTQESWNRVSNCPKLRP